MNLILKMQKGNDFITIKCKDKNHYDKLISRFKNNGYKQI
jgi:hypothetical protein